MKGRSGRPDALQGCTLVQADYPVGVRGASPIFAGAVPVFHESEA